MTVIRRLTEEDHAWFQTVWKESPELGGSAGVAWHRWTLDKSGRHRIDGMENIGFVDWLLRQDGGRTINNVAVGAAFRRQGFARRLVEHVGRPVRLVTNADNFASNAFYSALGFVLLGRKPKKNGDMKNVWELF